MFNTACDCYSFGMVQIREYVLVCLSAWLDGLITYNIICVCVCVCVCVCANSILFKRQLLPACVICLCNSQHYPDQKLCVITQFNS